MTLFRDSFNRTDSSEIGPSYRTLTSKLGSTSKIFGNTLVFDTSSTVTLLLVDAVTPTSADQFAGMDAAVSGGPAGSQGVFLRGTPNSANNGITGYIARITATNFAIKRQDDGSSTTLASYTIAQGTADRLGFKAVGTTLTAYYKGVKVMETTDATYTSGSAGVINSVTSGVAIDNLEAGNTATDLPATGYGSASTPTDPPPTDPPPTGNPTGPGAITGLSVSAVTASSALLSWNADPGASDYQVQIRQSGTSTWYGSPSGSGARATLSLSKPGTDYDAQVRSTAPNKPSGPWASISVTTAAGPPAPTPTPGGSGAYRGLTWTLDGQMILPGEPLHRLRLDPYGPSGPLALPSWLTASGSVTQGQDKGGHVALRGTDAAPASLTLTPDLATTDVAAVWVELDHFRWSGASPAAGYALTVGTQTTGARLAESGSDDVAKLRAGSASVDSLIPNRGSLAYQRRRVGLLVIPSTREAFAMDGEQILGYADLTTSWADGAAPVSLVVTGVGELRIARLTVTTYL